MGRLTMLVELPNGERQWYIVAKKLFAAFMLEKELGENHAFDKFRGNYITVPYSMYDDKSRAKLTVGKVVKVRWYKGRNVPKLYTRSQFITGDRLGKIKLAYRYLRHDYRWINRVRIALALLYWKHRRRRDRC